MVWRDKEIVELLLAEGADIEVRDNQGRTALMHAALRWYPEIVAQLLEAGAGIEAQQKNGWTALMHAARQEHKEIVELLLKAGTDGYKG